jgi:superfamily II DNA or RNA helicase
MQQEDVRGLLIFFGVGTGKTITSLLSALQWIINQPVNLRRNARVLVITGLSIVEQFSNEFKKICTTDECKAHEDQFKFKTRRSAVTYLNGKTDEEFRNMFIIVDESQHIKNPKSKLASLLIEKRLFIPKIMLLSATPLQNSIADIMTPLILLNPRKNQLPMSIKAFNEIFGNDGRKRRSYLLKLLKNKVSYYKNPIDDKNFPRREDLRPKAVYMADEPCAAYERLIKKNEQEYERTFDAATREEHEASAKAMTFWNGPRKMMNYMSIKDANNNDVIYMPKIKKLVKYVVMHMNAKERCIVYSSFVDEHGLEQIRSQLRKSGIKKDRIILINGKVPKNDRQTIVNKYNESKNGIALLISKAGAEGLDLKMTASIHILEPHFHNELIEQVIGRGIRYKSHVDQNGVPIKNAVVKVYTYLVLKCKKYKEGEESTYSTVDILMKNKANEKANLIKQFITEFIIPSCIEGPESDDSDESG